MPMHIGKLIKKRLEEVGISKSEFARRIHRTSQNVYDIFERQSLDTALLQTISEILNYDFFQHCVFEYTAQRSPDLSETLVKEDSESYKTMPELVHELTVCNEKHRYNQKELELLKKENVYLKEINELLKEKGKN